MMCQPMFPGRVSERRKPLCKEKEKQEAVLKNKGENLAVFELSVVPLFTDDHPNTFLS